MRHVSRLWAVLAVLSLWLHPGAALAAPPTPAADDLRFTYYGTLLGAPEGSIALTTDDGAQVSFQLSAEAKIDIPAQKGATAAALADGARVRVTVERATPQAEWSVVRVRVLGSPSGQIAAQQAAPAALRIAGRVQTSDAASLTLEQATGAQAAYNLTADTRLLPAGLAQAPVPGDRVILIFRRGASAGDPVWAIVVLPNLGPYQPHGK